MDEHGHHVGHGGESGARRGAHGHEPLEAPLHVGGAAPPRSLEDSLREFVRNSPYAVISLALHAVVLIVLWSTAVEPVELDEARTIKAGPPEVADYVEPPPPPETEPEDFDEVIDDPTVSDVVTDEPLAESPSLESTDNSPMSSSVIGPGAGPGEFGRGGPPGGKISGTRSDGIAHTEVDAALRWLMYHQDRDGYWSANAFDDECFRQDDGSDQVACSGRGKPVYDVGVTGLSMLAFLGAGHTSGTGPYRDVIKRGLRWLLENQRDDGNFADPRHDLHTYDHSIATLAMLEAAALSPRDRRLRKSAQRGIDYLMTLKNPGAAWRYGDPSSDEMLTKPNDVSVTGWVVMVLSLARELDYRFDADALDDALVFLDEMTDPVTGRTGYTSRGGRSSRPVGAANIWPAEQTEAMTAVAMLCRRFVDPDQQRPGAREANERGAALLAASPLVWSDDADAVGARDFYYWYYASYALYQHGGKTWSAWQKSLEEIGRRQVKHGEQRGSWDPSADPWGAEGGRVYATALLALTLEVPYRYALVSEVR